MRHNKTQMHKRSKKVLVRVRLVIMLKNKRKAVFRIVEGLKSEESVQILNGTQA